MLCVREHVLQVKAWHDPSTDTLTYLVWNLDTGDAVIIDPVLDFDALRWQVTTASVERVIQFVRERGLRVHWIVETHAHADHLTGAQLLKEAFDAPVAIGSAITKVQEVFREILWFPEDFKVDGSQFDHLLGHDDHIAAGELSVRVIATPGHTPACVSYHIDDAVFTGDALFMDDHGTGRTDFPGGSAEALYRSVSGRLYALSGKTRVFVGHDYQPGGRELRYETTIERARTTNLQLREETTMDDFVTLRRERDAALPPPKLLYQSLQVNLNGGKLPPVNHAGHRYLHMPLHADLNYEGWEKKER